MNKGDEDQGYTKKRRHQQEQDQVTGDQPDQPKMRHAQSDWKFDSSKHQRRRHKDATFRFYFGGFWYPQPYWQGYGLVGGRIGCAEGRSIVRERGCQAGFPSVSPKRTVARSSVPQRQAGD
jgi:hypothetical protein